MSRISLLLLIVAAGCGAPGEPLPPSPPIPTAVTDLTARQDGDGVQLSFTVPAKSVAGDRLAASPAVEIYRGSLDQKGKPDLKSFRNVYAIPGALVSSYVSEGRLEFTVPIAPYEEKSHPGAVSSYLVRSRSSQKHASSDSNIVSLHIFPAPDHVSSLDVQVTETAIELRWPATTRTSAGDNLSSNPSYHLYRGELAPDSGASEAKDFPQGQWKAKQTLLASPETNQYRDTAFDFGKVYVYTVRTVVPGENQLLESNDSPPARVSPRDTFPPAAPQNLAAAVLPGSAAGTLQVDLSWSINLEADLAGYRVRKTEEQGRDGALLGSELLPSPAVRDTSVQPGHRYWYTVTAVDRTGNESAASPSIAVEVTQPTP